MFFKVIYYLIGLGIVTYKLYRLGKPELTRDFWDTWRWHEEAKEKGETPTDVDEWKEKLGVDHFNEVLLLAGMAILEFSWLIVGLFSYNWLLFLVFLAYGVIANKMMKKTWTVSRSSYVSSTQMNLFIGVCVILFALINTFHLHIDLVKLIFGG